MFYSDPDNQPASSPDLASLLALNAQLRTTTSFHPDVFSREFDAPDLSPSPFRIFEPESAALVASDPATPMDLKKEVPLYVPIKDHVLRGTVATVSHKMGDVTILLNVLPAHTIPVLLCSGIDPGYPQAACEFFYPIGSTVTIKHPFFALAANAFPYVHVESPFSNLTCECKSPPISAEDTPWANYSALLFPAAQPLMKQAKVASSLKLPALLLSLAERLLETDPKSLLALAFKARALTRLQKYEEALALYNLPALSKPFQRELQATEQAQRESQGQIDVANMILGSARTAAEFRSPKVAVKDLGPDWGGMGLVAAEDLPAGTLLLSAEPLFSHTFAPEDLILVMNDGTSFHRNYSGLLFHLCLRAKLDSSVRQAVQPLCPGIDQAFLLNKIRCNAFCCKKGDNFKMWLHGTLSFANHSCNPNAEIVSVRNLSMMRSRRPIKAGEQILIHYLADNSQLREERRRTLLLSWGFSCRCDLCTLEASADYLPELVEEILEHRLGAIKQLKERGKLPEVLKKLQGLVTSVDQKIHKNPLLRERFAEIHRYRFFVAMQLPDKAQLLQTFKDVVEWYNNKMTFSHLVYWAVCHEHSTLKAESRSEAERVALWRFGFEGPVFDKFFDLLLQRIRQNLTDEWYDDAEDTCPALLAYENKEQPPLPSREVSAPSQSPPAPKGPQVNAQKAGETQAVTLHTQQQQQAAAAPKTKKNKNKNKA